MKVRPQSEHNAANIMIFKKFNIDVMITVYDVIVDFLAFPGFEALKMPHYLFKVNNKNTRTMCVICSKLAKKIPTRRRPDRIIFSY